MSVTFVINVSVSTQFVRQAIELGRIVVILSTLLI